jgi:hypothetical protein
MTGVEATLTLAALLALTYGGTVAGRHLRWMRAQARERAGWEQATAVAYAYELWCAHVEARAAARQAAAVSASLEPEARALRPIGTPLDIYRSRT